MPGDSKTRTGPVNRIRTLLVEDDPGDTMLLRRYLARSITTRFEVNVATRLAEAVERLGEETFDVVVLDLSLPDSHGLQTLSRIREAAPDTALVVMTGLDDEELALATANEGAHGYMAKGEASTASLVRHLRLAIERHRMVHELEAARTHASQLAERDPLTGLANRLLLEQELSSTIESARQSGRSMAAMMIDLDHFKRINDTFGHPAGDYVLRKVAKRLRENVRVTDSVARLGGDEFVVVLQTLSCETDAAQVAETLRSVIAKPIAHLDSSYHTGCSIGIATFPSSGQDPGSLLKAADLALYHAKRAGRGVFRFYTESMRKEVVRRTELEANLSAALETGEFVLHYQPIVDLASDRIVGAEALLRWHHGGQLVPPADFLPVAEETGMIVPIGEWVMVEACRQAAEWTRGVDDDFYVAVNLSPSQLRLGDVWSNVLAALESSGLAASRLQLEITESSLVDESGETREALGQIRGLGVRIAIDDFGTGYSCLAYLKRLPLDAIKIDRAFVAGLPDELSDAKLTATIVTMANGFGAETIAEGIERVDQVDFLREVGCPKAQGFLFSPPVPPESIAVLRAHSSPGWWRKRLD